MTDAAGDVRPDLPNESAANVSAIAVNAAGRARRTPLRRLNPESLGRPAGAVQSHVVVAPGGHVRVGGQTAHTGDGEIVADDVVGQFDQALANVVAAVEDAGANAEDLVRMRVYCTDLDAYAARAAEIEQIIRDRLAGAEPAMTVLGVTRLLDPDALVLVEATAAADTDAVEVDAAEAANRSRTG